jgi:hypothetical protein
MQATPWEEIEKRFLKVHGKLKREFEAFPADRLTRRVLVPSQPGLEESSRYWSAAMVARHLTIVGLNMEDVIVELSHWREIPRVADTAAVKPELERNSADSIPEYIAFGDQVLGRIRNKIGQKSARATFVHHWFGKMTAHQWFYLLFGHTALHLRQLRAIRKELAVSSSRSS